MAVQTYEETMQSVNATREEKLVATFFLNGGMGLSEGMRALITALVCSTDAIVEQIRSAPEGEEYEISVARIAEAVDAYRLDS